MNEAPFRTLEFEPDDKPREWSLPENLRRMVEQQGEPSEELFVTFIKEALDVSVDENDIIGACLEHRQNLSNRID
jgi:hypothetical protein